jgi:hypothetical protein
MFERLRSLITAPKPAQEPTPQTQIVGGGNIGKSDFERMGYDTPDKNHVDNVRKWRKIYRRGGPAATCVDAFPLFTMSNSYEFTCEEGDKGLKDQVIAWTDQAHVNLDSIMWQGILDAIICGTAFQEIVMERGGNIWGIVPRDASSFRIKYDEYGRVAGYEQVVSDTITSRVVKGIEKDRMLALTIFPVPGEMYGASLVERAYDDLMRDCDMIESVCTGVHRHGTAKNQVKCGTQEEPSSPSDRTKIANDYSNVGPKNDWVTSHLVDIKPVDTALAPLEQYPNMTLQRVAAAFGVPDELVGLGRGSTEATATVRLIAFYRTIKTIQYTIARDYSKCVIDKITGKPGAVWIKFPPVSEQDFLQMAQAIAQLRTGMFPDAIAYAKWAQEKLGIPPNEDEIADVEPTEQVPPTQTPEQVKDFLMNQLKPAA